MSDNYVDTAYRIYEDISLLHNKGRLINTCYLSGYIFECYCKILIDVARGLGANISRTRTRNFGHDFNLLSQEVDLNILTFSRLSGYCVDLTNQCSNTLNDWSPNIRYTSDNNPLNNQDKADKFVAECELLIHQILKMELDGVI